MPCENSGFINVDELLPAVTPAAAAAYYGFPLPQQTSERELRLPCPFGCLDQGDNPRAVAVELTAAHNPLVCHKYGCEVRGNLLTLMWAMKHGTLPSGGRLKGSQFKEMAHDLQSIARGATAPPPRIEATPDGGDAPAEPPLPSVNVPLKYSDNERARQLVHLDDKFVTDVSQMPPAASLYFRQRPYLTPEICHKWRMGYLPQDAKGLLRGRIVYPLFSQAGDVLTWFGRDPQFEEKRAKWIRAGKPETGEPHKFRFVKTFQRGLELFGQQAARLEEPGYRETIRELGILLVEGPNDVIALDALGVPAVGLCSNTVTAAQAEKLAQWAHRLSDGTVTVLLDCDTEGAQGAKQVVWELSQRCRVRTAWSSTMFDGRFEGRQPESLSSEEWNFVRATLQHGANS